jgi:hypothetical protein
MVRDLSISSTACQLQIWGKDKVTMCNRQVKIHARCPACPFCHMSSIDFLTTSKAGWMDHGLNFQRILSSCWRMWNWDKAFWTQNWSGLEFFCFLMSTFRWCLLLPPDVQHLLRSRVIAATIYTKMWKVKTVMVHSFAYVLLLKIGKPIACSKEFYINGHIVFLVVLHDIHKQIVIGQTL